jgi:hypothetical protein
MLEDDGLYCQNCKLQYRELAIRLNAEALQSVLKEVETNVDSLEAGLSVCSSMWFQLVVLTCEKCTRDPGTKKTVTDQP